MEYRRELENKLRYDKEIPISEVLIRIGLEENYYDHFTIVEGNDDIAFYYNTNTLKKISNNKIISAPSKKFDDIVGKKHVINTYQRIKADKNLSNKMYKYIFIVDRDYDGIDRYYDTLQKRYVDLSKQEKRCISCTKYYAIENYFLTEENLQSIFSIFDLHYEYEKFYKEFKKFVSETKELFALIAVTIYAVNNGIRIPGINLKMQDIFSCFKFKEKYCYNGENYVYDRERFELAVLERKNAINSCGERSILYKKKKEYEEWIENENYIQGHTAYEFLRQYFMQYFGIDIKPKHYVEGYMKILRGITVDIELKYGNGKVIEK